MTTDFTGLVVTSIKRLEWTASKLGTYPSTTGESYKASNQDDYTFGTGNNQVNQLWRDRRTLTAGAADNLDLAGGITNGFGVTATFAKVKEIKIHNRSANQTVPTTATLTVGNGSNPFIGWFGAGTHTEGIALDGTMHKSNPLAGWTVTGGTGDNLKILNDAGALVAEYDIEIAGVSA